MDPVGGNRNKQPDDTGGVKAGGSDPADVASRPRRTLLLVAGVVVLVVGGFALSRDYGVQSIPSPPNFEEIATPTTLSTAGPSTSTTTAPLAADTTPLESFDSAYDDWMYLFQDLAVSPYGGSIVGVAGGGVAWHWLDVGDWDVLDVDALPIGTGLDDGSPGRIITQVATGPSQVTAGPSTDGDVWSGVWFSGYSTSHADDDEFGGVLDGWTGSRVLDWVASYHCPVCGHWTVWTTNDVPELSGGIGDLAVSGDGTVYASVGEDLLMVLNGYQGTGWDEWKSHGEWKSYEVPLPTDSSGVSYPWSSSLAVGIDGVVWAGYNYDTGGVVRFDGADFTRYTTEDGLPSGKELRVSAAGDGTIWAATERSGVASFDGTTWTSYTTADGLLSNQAVIAAGNDGTVWAVHLDDPPFGYSRFDGSEWTTYSFDFEVGGYRAEISPDGTLWTISDEGLISFDGITRTIHPSPFVPTLPGTITVSIDGWGV